MGCTAGGSQNYSLVTVVNVTVSQTRQLDGVPRAKQVLTRQHMVSLPEGRKLQGMEIHPALCAWKSFVCSADQKDSLHLQIRGPSRKNLIIRLLFLLTQAPRYSEVTHLHPNYLFIIYSMTKLRACLLPP